MEFAEMFLKSMMNTCQKSVSYCNLGRDISTIMLMTSEKSFKSPSSMCLRSALKPGLLKGLSQGEVNV